jgi:hypothetical protein
MIRLSHQGGKKTDYAQKREGREGISRFYGGQKANHPAATFRDVELVATAFRFGSKPL